MREPEEAGRTTRWIELAGQDVRFAWRALRKTPTVTIAAVLTLAVGVGLNTAIFSVVESVLLHPLSYRDPASIVALAQVDPTNPQADGASLWTIGEWRRRSRSFRTISVYDDAQLTLVENGEAEALRGMRVSFDFFDTLGVNMTLGRAFRPDEDRSSPANVIVLTHDLWIRRFGGDPRIVGRVLNLNTQQYRVIGVLPEEFHPLRMTNPAETPQFYGPAGWYDVEEAAPCRTCFRTSVIGRLQPSITAGEAAAELSTLMRELAREYPTDYPREASVRAEPLLDHLIGPVRMLLWTVFGAVAFVLLIACANVASLQLTRAAARTREFALRAAIGGSRSRLIAQLLIENILLSILGGAAGVLVAWLGTTLIASRAPRELPRLDETHMDVRVLLFALSTTLVTGIVFGTAPAWLAARINLSDALKRTIGLSGRSHGGRLRSALVAGNLALAFVLVVATGLLGQSLHNLMTVDAGFDPHRVLTLTPAVPAKGQYATPDGRLSYYRQLIEKVRNVPGVTAAGMVSNVPLSHAEPMTLRIDGQSPVSDADAPSADVFWVSPDYLRVLEVPLRRGRFLIDRDGVDAPPAALISESLARARFAGTNPIGRRIQLGSQQEHRPWLMIVGIVGDVRSNGLERKPREAVYEPQAMNPFHYSRLVARTTADPWRFERAVRAAIREVDATTGVFHVQPMDDYVASSLADRSFVFALIALFGTLALLLSAIGIYGLVSYSVVLRTPEIGVRAALGASKGNLFALILQQGMALAAIGLGLGLLIALAAARLLASFLFGVASTDPRTLAATAIVLAGATALASSGPARTATRIEPLEALRAD